MTPQELIEHILTRDPVREANYCMDCHEYVEEPMMVCNYYEQDIVKVFHNDAPAKKLAEMLKIALRAIECMKAANPYPDLSYAKYVDGFKFAEDQAEKAMAAINSIAESDNEHSR